MAQPVRSFIEVPRDSHFPIQNLPFGVFQPRHGSPRIGVAIGNLVLDLSILEELGYLDVVTEGIVAGGARRQRIFGSDSLNAFMALGRPAWKKTRDILQHLLAAETATLRDNAELRDRVFYEQSEMTMRLPACIGDYTDFYSSYHHAHNVGTMLRGPENALMPNWKWLPVAYHGRASSVVISGTDVKRPRGQTKTSEGSAPVFGPSRSLDFELEAAFFIGPGNELGRPVPIERAEDHIFANERLECARYSDLGISAARAVPGQEFLHQHFALGCHPGGTGTVSKATRAAGSTPALVFGPRQ